jgi:hypothetical protein
LSSMIPVVQNEAIASRTLQRKYGILIFQIT